MMNNVANNVQEEVNKPKIPNLNKLEQFSQY